jgi:hypothetical protein
MSTDLHVPSTAGAGDDEGGAHLFLFCIEAHAFGNVFPTLVTPDVEGHFKPAMQ